MKGATHIGRAFELLADTGKPGPATNGYDLLNSETPLMSTVEKLTDLSPTERRNKR